MPIHLGPTDRCWQSSDEHRAQYPLESDRADVEQAWIDEVQKPAREPETGQVRGPTWVKARLACRFESCASHRAVAGKPSTDGSPPKIHQNLCLYAIAMMGKLTIAPQPLYAPSRPINLRSIPCSTLSLSFWSSRRCLPT